jgi:hypothetical protein
MQKVSIIFAIMLIMVQGLYAQETPSEECGTPPMPLEEAMKQPWFNNEKWFVNYQDSMNTLYRIADQKIKSDPNYNSELSTNSTYFLVPIKFWIYSPFGGNSQPYLTSDFTYQSIMDRTNAAFQRSGIPVQFYLKCVSFIENPLVSDGVTGAEELIVGNLYRDPGSINIHVVNGDLSTNARQGEYNSFCRAIFLRSVTLLTESSSGIPSNSATTHEIGHYWGLAHTNNERDERCTMEPVTRNIEWDWCPTPTWAIGLFGVALPWQKCLSTADWLCDTDAAPASTPTSNINYGYPIRNPDTDCNYTGNQTDYRGDVYHHDLRNFMLIGARNDCRSHFSPQQSTILTRGIDADYDMCNQTWCDQIDTYEPDNHQTSACAKSHKYLYQFRFV